MSFSDDFSSVFIVRPSYTCHNTFLLWVFPLLSGLVFKWSTSSSAQYLGEYLFSQVQGAVGYAPLHCLTVGPHW